MMGLIDYEHAINDSQKATAANLLVEREFVEKGQKKKTLKEVAEEIGVTDRTILNWKKDPMFLKYMEALSEVRLAEYRSMVDSQLVKLIRGDGQANGLPSVKGLELYYKLSGRLVERSEVLSETVPERTQKPITNDVIEQELKQLSDKLK